jgi:hypothetical protein
MAACFFASSSEREVPMKPRTIGYVDGFNFYYGAVRGTPADR